jgi:hypothetical protein
MKKLYIYLLVIIVSFGAAPPVAAEDQPPLGLQHIVIAAVQTGEPAASGKDFIELYNPTASVIDVTGWKLQYRAASSTGTTGWTAKRTIACLDAVLSCTVAMQPRSSLLFATYDIADIQEQPLTSGFSDVGGQLRLVDAEGTAQDMLGYGSALVAEGQGAAPAPPAGQALVRISADDGTVVDTNDNAKDFRVGCYAPVPNGEIMPTQPPAPQPCPDPQLSEDEDEGVMLGDLTQAPTAPGSVIVSYPQVLITELLPDPASPLTDSADEFIELFNPTAQTVNLEGYVLEAGADFRYRYKLGDMQVMPGGFVTIMATESHLSLTNSGTAVRLLDPNGVISDQIASYGQAKTGQSWAKSAEGVWQWTTTSTPAAQNAFTAPAAASAAAAKKTTTKVAKTTAAKAKVSGASKTSNKAASTPPPLAAGQDQGGGFNYLLLVPILVIALGYICYEYRHELVKNWRRVRGVVVGKKDPTPTPQTD